MTIEQNIDKINVVVTTYDQATKKLDSKFLRRLDPTVCALEFLQTLLIRKKKKKLVLELLAEERGRCASMTRGMLSRTAAPSATRP